MSVKTQLLDVEKRPTKYNKKLGIIANGIDNAYGERIERFINNSVTAKTAANIMASYLAGKGFGEDNKFIVNKKKGLTLQAFTNILSRCLSKQNGAYIHVNYNGNYKFVSMDVLPYTHNRKGKKDDDKYNGKIRLYDNFNGDNGRIYKDKISSLDVFNPDEKVIEAQVKKAGGWDNYKGQILYINLDPEYDYALSKIDPVAEDCDSEAQSSTYKNKSLRKGFFGKTLVVTKPLAGKREDYNNDAEYGMAVSERSNFKKTVTDFVGVENVGGALHVEMEHDGDDFAEAIMFKNIDSNINDKLFKYTEESVFQNILMAFNNLPIGLVRSDNSLFSNSGDSLRVMKETYYENTSQERDSMEQVIKLLLNNFKDYKGSTNLIPLITIKDANTSNK